MSETTKSVLMRFARAFLFGFVASASTMVYVAETWKDLGMLLNTILLAGIVSGIGATFQAADKYLRS